MTEAEALNNAARVDRRYRNSVAKTKQALQDRDEAILGALRAGASRTAVAERLGYGLMVVSRIAAGHEGSLPVQKGGRPRKSPPEEAQES